MKKNIIIKLISSTLLFFIFREVLRFFLWLSFTQILFGNLFEFIHNNSFYYPNIPMTYYIYTSEIFPLSFFTLKVLVFCLLVHFLFQLSKQVVQYIGNWIDKGEIQVSNIFLSKTKQKVVHRVFVFTLFFMLVITVLLISKYPFDKQIHHIMNPGFAIGIDLGKFTFVLAALQLIFLYWLMIFLFKSIQKILLYFWT